MPLPHAFELLPRIAAARARAGHLLVGLDFDGTLTPIVPHPDDAHLPPRAAAVLERLARRPDTTVAILSGRALDDVRARTPVPGAWYAGNHGLEIAGPALAREHPAAAACRPAIERLVRRLTAALGGVAGAFVEDKRVTASVHYRNVAEPEQGTVRDVALRLAESEPQVRVTEGKCVVELRPAVDWHKGAALRFLRDSLPHHDTPTAFIGDDVTDEDAFRALPAADGWGIVVAEALARETAAHAWLRDPGEVLEWLAAAAG